MTHIAIQEQLDGKVVEWMEKVTDERSLWSRLATRARLASEIFLNSL
jgi:hypothetical protein